MGSHTIQEKTWKTKDKLERHSEQGPSKNGIKINSVRTCFGSRSFAVAAPTTWNSLPLHIRNSSSIFGFHRQLKTFLYNLAFHPSASGHFRAAQTRNRMWFPTQKEYTDL